MLPCLSVSFSLQSLSSSRQQPWICLRSLLSMGSQFCRGGVPTGVCGEGQKHPFNWRLSWGRWREPQRGLGLCRSAVQAAGRELGLLPLVGHLKPMHNNRLWKHVAMF